MNATTRAQRVALKRVYDRCPLYRSHAQGFTSLPNTLCRKPVSYRTFRKSAYVTRDGLMVQWCGMWLGIERDGYTHS